jgi:magnesium transporter
MSKDFLQMPPQTTVAEALSKLHSSNIDHEVASYIYVTDPVEGTMLGVVDLRRLVTADDKATLKDLMSSPVVTVDETTIKDDIAQLFAKYHYRMLPVVDSTDHILGVIHYNDIMKGLVTRAQI